MPAKLTLTGLCDVFPTSVTKNLCVVYFHPYSSFGGFGNGIQCVTGEPTPAHLSSSNSYERDNTAPFSKATRYHLRLTIRPQEFGGLFGSLSLTLIHLLISGLSTLEKPFALSTDHDAMQTTRFFVSQHLCCQKCDLSA